MIQIHPQTFTPQTWQHIKPLFISLLPSRGRAHSPNSLIALFCHWHKKPQDAWFIPSSLQSELKEASCPYFLFHREHHLLQTINTLSLGTERVPLLPFLSFEGPDHLHHQNDHWLDTYHGADPPPPGTERDSLTSFSLSFSNVSAWVLFPQMKKLRSKATEAERGAILMNWQQRVPQPGSKPMSARRTPAWSHSLLLRTDRVNCPIRVHWNMEGLWPTARNQQCLESTESSKWRKRWQELEVRFWAWLCLLWWLRAQSPSAEAVLPTPSSWWHPGLSGQWETSEVIWEMGLLGKPRQQVRSEHCTCEPQQEISKPVMATCFITPLSQSRDLQ